MTLELFAVGGRPMPDALSSSDSFAALCSALEATQKTNAEWVCRCPSHADSDPSLWLRLSESGEILLHCFAGCSQQEVIDALESRGLWSASHAKSKRSTPPGVPYFWPPAPVLAKRGLKPSVDTQKQYTKHWVYRDLNDKIIGHVVRYDGHGKKDVIPFFKKWDDGNWRSGHEVKTCRTLYGLHRLRGDTGNGQVIFIVEGEKCADAITAPDNSIVGITWPGGAKSFNKADFNVLRGYRDIRLWPDNDKAGVDAMRGVGKILDGLDIPHTRVDLVRFGPIPQSWDCADYLAENTLENVLTLPLLASPRPVMMEVEPSGPALNDRNDAAGDDPHFALTDVGNGARFVRAQASTARYVPGVGWHFFNGNIWEQDPCEEALARAAVVAAGIVAEAGTMDEDAAKPIMKWAQSSQNVTRLDAMLRVAKSHREIVLEVGELDPQIELIGVDNGMLNLATGELIPPDASYLCSRKLHFAHDPSAECPMWEKFISDVMLGDAAMINFIQRAIGYSISGDCSEQKMFFCYGPNGSNGKSVFLETLFELAGNYATQTPVDLILLKANGDESSSNTIARLRGARLVNGNEVPRGARLNESRIKELTGQDTIAARFLYKEFFEFKPQCKFWIRSNYRPEVRSQDNGIWRRMITIPFNLTVAEADKDKKLPQKLRTELAGIFNWAVAGYQMWKHSGLQIPAPCLAATAEYREDMDTLGAWLSQRCSLIAGMETSASLLYESYKDWCKSAGEHPMTMRRLMLSIKDRGIQRVIRRDARYYSGITLRTDIMSGEVSSEILGDGIADDGFNF